MRNTTVPGVSYFEYSRELSSLGVPKGMLNAALFKDKLRFLFCFVVFWQMNDSLNCVSFTICAFTISSSLFHLFFTKKQVLISELMESWSSF